VNTRPPDEYGSVLQRAICRGHIDVSQLLIQRGADVDAPQPMRAFAESFDARRRRAIWWTPLDFAIHRGTSFVEMLFEAGACVRQKHVIRAAFVGDTQMLSALLDRGGDVNHAGEGAQTPLQTAVGNENMGVTRMLLARGADVDCRDRVGQTPLHHACSLGRLDFVGLLRGAGASVDVRDVEGRTPLFSALELRALERGSIEVVDLLLEQEPDVTVADRNGFTSLHQAAVLGDLELIEQLVARGADREAGTIDGWPPVKLAHEHGQDEVVERFRDWGVDLSTLKSDRRDTTDPWLYEKLWANARCGDDLGVLRGLTAEAIAEKVATVPEGTPDTVRAAFARASALDEASEQCDRVSVAESLLASRLCGLSDAEIEDVHEERRGTPAAFRDAETFSEWIEREHKHAMDLVRDQPTSSDLAAVWEAFFSAGPPEFPHRAWLKFFLDPAHPAWEPRLFEIAETVSIESVMHGGLPMLFTENAELFCDTERLVALITGWLPRLEALSESGRWEGLLAGASLLLYRVFHETPDVPLQQLRDWIETASGES